MESILVTFSGFHPTSVRVNTCISRKGNIALQPCSGLQETALPPAHRVTPAVWAWPRNLLG